MNHPPTGMVDAKPPKLCVVTAGHLATCPRMLKAADAFLEAGYDVHVVSTRHIDWAWKADQALGRTRNWDWSVVSYERAASPITYLRSGMRYKAACRRVRRIGVGDCALNLAADAYGRVHRELVNAVCNVKPDLIYGGTCGALAAVAEAARKKQVPFALDLEDFHTGELMPSAEAQLVHGLAERIENEVLPAASFLTAGSEAIAAEYRRKYGVTVEPINNVFSLALRSAQPTPAQDRLSCYWFSQTVGPNRGLEDVVRALALANVPAGLYLRGQASNAYVHELQQLAADAANLDIQHLAPDAPDRMVELCRNYDVGLAVEQPCTVNRALCLTNKAFTYMLAGLAIVISDTEGQRPVANALGENVLRYCPGDVDTLARGLKRWAEDKAALQRAKQAAWEAARHRWHWEHPLESGRLLRLVHETWENAGHPNLASALRPEACRP